MISSNNLKQILTGLFNKNKEEHDKDINRLDINMNKGWISSGTIDDIRGNDTTNDTPVGSIIAHMGNNAPLHYLVCDGSEYNISDYPELTDFFNIQFGSINYFGGDGITTFCVPDLRGEFLRGSGTNNHTNCGSGSNVGEHQDATVHRGIVTNSINSGYTRIATQNLRNPDENGDITSINPDYEYQTGDWEVALSTSWDKSGGHARSFNSRPTNTSVLYCIKYESTKLLSISMYDGTHYSTEELLIGQWIDGKPIYRKTFIIGTPSNGDWHILDSNTIFETANLVRATGKRSVDGSLNLLRDLPYFNTTSDYCCLEVGAFDNQLKIFTRVPSGDINELTVTVEYTKTTDTPFTVDEDIAWVALESDVNDVLNNIGE